MDLLLIQSKGYTLDDIKHAEMNWGGKRVFEGMLPVGYVRDRFRYLTFDMKDGRSFVFRQDTWTGNVTAEENV